MPPTSFWLLLTPIVMTPIVDQFFDVGIASIVSFVTTARRTTLCVSTTGDAPVTVTVSSICPTRMSAFTGAVKSAVSSMPSRLTVENPGRLNVTVYVPGRSSTILYWPFSSVTTERTRSISTGLLASTVTPGITAPVASLTTPAIALACANAIVGAVTRHATTTRPRAIVLIAPPGNRADDTPAADEGQANEPLY